MTVFVRDMVPCCRRPPTGRLVVRASAARARLRTLGIGELAKPLRVAECGGDGRHGDCRARRPGRGSESGRQHGVGFKRRGPAVRRSCVPDPSSRSLKPVSRRWGCAGSLKIFCNRGGRLGVMGESQM
jgi:hypothetical protein